MQIFIQNNINMSMHGSDQFGDQLVQFELHDNTITKTSYIAIEVTDF